MPSYYERIPHTADLAIRVWGADRRELFINAGRALLEMMADPTTGSTIERRIVVESIDQEGLLVDWLNELIFLNEVEKETYAQLDITELTDTLLCAVVRGSGDAHRLKTIKAATFHELAIEETPEGVEARVVFDV